MHKQKARALARERSECVSALRTLRDAIWPLQHFGIQHSHGRAVQERQHILGGVLVERLIYLLADIADMGVSTALSQNLKGCVAGSGSSS